MLREGEGMAELMSFTIWQIYYRDDQKKEIYPFSIPVYNEGLTIFFENDLIKRLVPTSETEYTAVASWTLSQKSRRIHPITPEALGSDYQVLSFTRNGRDHKMISMATHWHPDFLPAIKLLWEKLGLKMPGEARNPIYQNHFSCKTDIYKRYVSEFLSPAIEIIETDEELHEKMIKPSNYGRLSRDADLKAVKNKLGLNDYPLNPFVLERCPSLWFQMHNISVKYL
jgi:hypothetical protein